MKQTQNFIREIYILRDNGIVGVAGSNPVGSTILSFCRGVTIRATACQSLMLSGV